MYRLWFTNSSTALFAYSCFLFCGFHIKPVSWTSFMTLKAASVLQLCSLPTDYIKKNEPFVSRLTMLYGLGWSYSVRNSECPFIGFMGSASFVIQFAIPSYIGGILRWGCLGRVPRKICGPKRYEVTGEWSKLHIEELHDLYLSPSIIWVIKPRRMR